MSDQAPWNRRRLMWSHRSKVARWDGVAMALDSPPVLDGRPVYFIDYCPFTGIAQVQWRDIERVVDMTDHEQRLALRLLQDLTTAQQTAD